MELLQLFPGKPLADGYLSDGDASFFRAKDSSNYSACSGSNVEDGYLSEGGAIYARR